MKRFYILGLLILCTVMTVHAATYCAETITSTNDKHTAKITCSSLGGNKYQFVFVSTDAFTGYNAAGSNFYMNVNGVGGYHVSEHLTQDGNTLTAVIESNTVPTIYANAFFVNYSDGEAQFDIPTDADFSQTCSTSEGGGTEPPFDPNTNVALGKPVVAGHYDSQNELLPSYITDGDLNTRWSGDFAANDHSKDWVYIDLGNSYRLSEVDIYFEYAYSTNFVIQGAIELPDPVSDDSKWETLYSFSGNPNYTEKNEGGEEAKNAYMVSGVARYVRIRSYEKSLNNISIWEVRVYGKLVCSYSGGAGDGQTATGYSVFTTGYKLSLELHETEDSVVVVKAEYLDKDKIAEHAYMHNYGKDLAVINQIVLDREGDTQVFSQEIPFSSFKEADGVICFGVKFEIPESMRVTTPEYFYLDGLGCAERVFTIYHGVDLPDDAEKGAVTEYKGGRILQPIRYKRKLRPATWETLCLPFKVDSITVYDPVEKQNFKLYAQYRNGQNVIPGEFWLRKFVESEVTAGAAFQNNWQDIEANSQGEALPKMGVPYIIRVPGGDYYNDKYIVFHGAGYQTIAATNEAPIVPADGYFSYSGNQTMLPWNLQSAYVLDAQGEYFRSDPPVTLQPFECAVNATQATRLLYPRLMISSPQITTADGLPSTEYEGGRIYTTMGVLVGTFESLDEQENCVMHLPEGIYIVQRAQSISKIHITR